MSTEVQQDVMELLVYLSPMEDIFLYTGFVLLIMGFMAWATHKKRTQRNQWGKRIFAIGAGFIVIGTNFGGFMALVKYAVGP